MAEETTNGGGMPGPGPAKSRGQEILERMLGQFNRVLRIRHQLEKVRDQITPGETRPPTAARAAATGQATSFFGALDLLCDSNDELLDELERSVMEIGDLF
ncbi:hypothetical protein ACVWW6_006054 [Bradyrhizobium sp. USDA 3311]